MIFINRTHEMDYLDGLWRKKVAQLVVMYGKRRAGKTELIKQFMKNKRGIYYLADRRSPKDQLVELGKRIGALFSDSLVSERGFAEWEDLFAYLKHHAKKPIVLAIDEYPYLTEGDKAVGSLFQKGWDEYLKNSPVYLILCGSSIAMMESETLTYKAPLYGRRTGQLFIQPLSFKDAHLFFKRMPFVAFLKLFTVTGGMPAYLAQFAGDGQSLDEAIAKHILTKGTFLYNEVEFLVREELREPRLYLSILQAIALGNHRHTKIAEASGIASNVIQKYLGVLQVLHLIRREVPATEDKPEKSKLGLYKFADPFLQFWFNFVFPYKSELELGQIDYVLSIYKEQGVHLEARSYEDFAKEWVVQNSSILFPPQRVGKWWNNNSEMDLMMVNTRENRILFGEVKWWKHPVGLNVLDDLKAKSAQVEWGKGVRKESFILFSRSGFTDALLRRARVENVALVHGDRLVKFGKI